MGIDAATLGALTLAKHDGVDFTRVVTLGRQGVHMRQDEIGHFLKRIGRADLAARLGDKPLAPFCEDLLARLFGAGDVQSIDFSAYEQATIIHDMNKPLAPAQTFSLVADIGSLEHIFNVPVALDNIAALCAEGGHILHVLPGSNYSGHGFYQFSPELFFNAYSAARGFSNLRVFMVTMGKPTLWWAVKAPQDLKGRVNLSSWDQCYVIALVKKGAPPPSLAENPLQQSDYAQGSWSGEGDGIAKPKPARSEGLLAMRELIAPLRQRRKIAKIALERPRGDISAHKLADLVA